MIDKKILFITFSIAIAIVIGVVVGLFFTFAFPDWASENNLLIGIIIGSLIGPIYPILIKNKQKKLLKKCAS
jgi:predicted membrane-bound spermidine synthase